MTRESLPTALTAALFSAATVPSDAPAFDWKKLAWALASALIAAGLDWLRRWMQRPEEPPGEQTRNPPT